MSSALSQVLSRMGKSKQDFSKNSNLGKLFRRHGVEDSAAFRHILGLPRRKWSEDEDLEELIDKMTAWLKLPEGKMRLRPVQAKAIEELHDYGGLLAPIRVGAGKTLLSFLSPVVLGATRPLLIVPAKLKHKTIKEFSELKKHWLYHPCVYILSYEKISRDGGFELLEKINPDMIIADECHKLKNLAAGVTRKLRRWKKEHPETRWALMSGTITSRSLRDYAHLCRWALGKLSPVPDRANEIVDWADALDEKVDPMKRLKPGVLLGFCSDEELNIVAKEPNKATECARKGFRRRFVETPAIIATEEKALGVSLSITQVELDIKKECLQDFEKLREDWETPDGQPFSEPVDLWRHSRELACGFFYRWSPPGPPQWLAARKEWSRFVRQTLSSRRNGIDTEFQVAKACKAGQIDSTAYTAWIKIKDSFKPNTVPFWRHKKTLEYAKNWLAKEQGICWVEHVTFGNQLSFETQLPYFGEGGKDKRTGMFIEEASGPVIASISSNCEGRNLQKWNKNLIVSAPPNGRMWEQMLGRTHREGQEADEVSVDVLVCCYEQWAGIEQAIRDAQYVQDTTGQPQKLLYADKDFLTLDDIFKKRKSGNAMWSIK